MESLGGKLKTARTEKGLSLDQVCRETSIALRYVEAMESENFNVFPGEPYIIGFLRNYGNYLDLDPQKLVSLYKALRIQEQPIPVDKLLKPKREIRKFVIPFLISLIVLGAAGFGVYLLFFVEREKPIITIPERRNPVEYIMEGNSIERRFYRNDSILVQRETESYKLELVNLGDAVTIRTPGGSVVLYLSGRASVDLNNDGIPELRITVIDFEKNNPDMGALLYLSLEDGMALFDSHANVMPGMPETANNTSSIVSTVLPPPNAAAFNSAFPFTLQAHFQGYCMFRWEILNERERRDRNQRYFQRTDELSIQAQNGIRIWVSNAQAARFQVIGGGRTVPLEIGSAGEVVVADIRWIRDEDGRYRLVLVRLEI